MARTVNADEFAVKRNEILDAAQRLVYTKGYERMTIQDILDILQISKGAFYHYFDSKPAVLEAMIERIQETTNKPLLPILHNPDLSATEKLRGFFDTLDSLRTMHRAEVIKLARIWYTDENAIVRQKVEKAVHEQRAPLLVEIVRQGIQEGVFTTAYPDRAGEVILSLLQGMGNAHARLLFSPQPDHDRQYILENIIAVYDAYMDAIERVVGAPVNSLHRTDVEAMEAWLTASNNDI
jgi:AcrR family transcriptional regulator